MLVREKDPIGPSNVRESTVKEPPRDIVDQAYRHHTARIGKQPRPTLDDHAERAVEGASGSDSGQDRVSDQAGMYGEAAPILPISITA